MKTKMGRRFRHHYKKLCARDQEEERGRDTGRSGRDSMNGTEEKEAHDNGVASGSQVQCVMCDLQASAEGN